jgi:serine protease AprX
MKGFILSAFFGFFLIQNLTAQNPKISQKLLENFKKNNNRIEMIAILAAQADVSDAEQISDWGERGRYVHETLANLAEATQPNALNICAAFGEKPRSFWIANMISVSGNQQLAEALAALPEISQVVESTPFHVETPIDPQDDRGESAARNAITYEWGIQKIEADSVWIKHGKRGNGIVIGGADTGYKWDHPALKAAYRGWNGSMADHNYNWHDAIHQRDSIHYQDDNNACGYNSNVPCDDGSHGTHTMGTMVGKDSIDPASVQYIGVAPDARWIGCRNMERGYGTPITYSECFQWFLSPTDLNNANPNPSKRPHVINNSWGCPPDEGCNTAVGSTHWIIRTTLNNLRNAGTVVVVSAGNSGSNCHTIDTPAAIYAGSYTIGASNISDGIANFSSRGKVTVDSSNRQKPQIVAPGVNVRSSVPPSNYANFSGTSMAGPHTAGAVALLLNCVPTMIGNVSQVENLLNANSKSLPNASTQVCDGVAMPAGNPTIPNPIWGYGRLDIDKTVSAALTLPVELVSFSGKVASSVIRLQWRTATEILCSHFLVEKSIDGQTWKSIGRLEGHGTTNEDQTYQLLDNQPVTGSNFYRLNQFDFDGHSQKSKIVVVDFFKNSQLRAWPNPATDMLTLAFVSEKNTEATLTIFDENGRLMLQNQMPLVRGSLTYEMKVESLPSGLYFMRMVENDGGLLSEGKFLKN